jgi:hypothetical protein
MSYRTNPDRILENIDRARTREEEASRFSDDRQAEGRELDTTPPSPDATPAERMKRVFRLIDKAYRETAKSNELGKLAARFRAIGDLHHHHARGDVSVVVHYLDSDRRDDVGMSPFEIRAEDLEEMKKETESSRADVNALKILRAQLREGVMSSFKKIEPRIKDGLRERADKGHVSVTVTVDLRPAE